MLNCTLSMVEKTKQALELLQDGSRKGVHSFEAGEERARQALREAERRMARIEKKAGKD